MTSSISRKRFLRTAGMGALAAGTASAAFPAPTIAEQRRELKMASAWVKNFPGFGTAAERLAQRITEMSDGRMGVKVFAAGELVPPFEVFDAVSSGTADLYHGVEFWWQGKSKAFNFFTTTPFGLTPTEMKSWVYYGGGQVLWDELAARYNVKSFLVGNPGVQMGGWFRKEIDSLADFQGVKMRMGGFGGAVIERVGATAVSIPGTEVFQALQSGTIDATEWVGPWNDMAKGFQQVAKYYYYPGWHEPSSNVSAGVNLDLWNDLSVSERAIIVSACQAENDEMQAEFHFNNGAALESLVARDGVQLRPYSDDVLLALGKTAQEVVAEAAAEDAFTQKVYDSYMAFHAEARRVTESSDQPFARARSLVFEG